MNYPTSYKEFKTLSFSTRKFANDYIKSTRANIIKKPYLKGGKFLVDIELHIQNATRTGREMYVIDNNGVLHKDFITITSSVPFDGTSKISGFEGIFVNKSNWNCDIYVNSIFDNHPLVNEKIKELSIKGKAEYEYHMEMCKPSKHLIQNLLKSDWDKAKDAGVI